MKCKRTAKRLNFLNPLWKESDQVSYPNWPWALWWHKGEALIPGLRRDRGQPFGAPLGLLCLEIWPAGVARWVSDSLWQWGQPLSSAECWLWTRHRNKCFTHKCFKTSSNHLRQILSLFKYPYYDSWIIQVSEKFNDLLRSHSWELLDPGIVPPWTAWSVCKTLKTVPLGSVLFSDETRGWIWKTVLEHTGLEVPTPSEQ